MSRLQQPLDYQILWSTGDLILRAELDLLLKDSQGNWHSKIFRVDSASDMTTMPAHDRTITGRQIPLSRLNKTEKGFLALVRRKYKARLDWTRFAAWWNAEFNRSGLSAGSAVYRICQDLESGASSNHGRRFRTSIRQKLRQPHRARLPPPYTVR